MTKEAPSEVGQSGKRLSGDHSPSGFVYFINGEETGRVKIGWAVDVERRIASLQTGAAETLSVYAVIPSPDPRALERKLHRRFAPLRVRGEWFDCSDKIYDFADLYGFDLGATERLWVQMYDAPAPKMRL